VKKKRARKSDAYIGAKELRPESLMMTYGYDPSLSEGSVKTPIFQTSTFVFKSAEEGKAFFEMAYGLREAAPGEAMGLIYSRINNPDLEVLEDRLTLWEDAEACAVFASGMAAITTMLMEFLSPGDVLLHSEPLYGGTDHFIKHVLPRFQITPVGFAAGATRAEVDAAVAKHGKSGKLAMVYLETPANPTNAQVDIAMCASIAEAHSTKGRKVLVAVDNTFLGPLWQQPFDHGADLVLYSATKFLGGHSDLIGGACLGPKDLMSRVKAMRTFLGTMASPHTCWLLLRSLETLKLRMTSQMKNARYVADYLLQHPKVARVYYLGHLKEGTPEHALFMRQCTAAGSMISFDVKGGMPEAFRLLDALKLIKLAVSLGGTESLASHPAAMTHSGIRADIRERIGILETTIRLSIGVEHADDLIADLTQALAAA
jgi:methionine-gamma-lyase